MKTRQPTRAQLEAANAHTRRRRRVLKSRSAGTLFLFCFCLSCAAATELSFKPVALSGQLAPGLTNNIKFADFEYVSLADDGRIAFTAIPTGPGVTSTNNRGLWAGLPGDLNLLVRTGDLVPGRTNGETFTYLASLNIDNHRAVGFLAKQSGDDVHEKVSRAFQVQMESDVREEAREDLLETKVEEQVGPLFLDARYNHYNGYVINVVAGRAELFGPGIGPTNNIAIVAGPPTNAAIVVRTGFPAPGVSGNFTFFPSASQAMALTPDGNVAFKATATDGDGIWFGKAGTVQLVALQNRPAPASLLGPGYTFGFISLSLNVEVNARGEVAFAANLNGPGLNSTNSTFVVAGPPGGLRVIAQSGQPAPGIPGAVFGDFSQVLLGTDGTAAFLARYTTNGTDYVSGLWLAPTNGATPRLLMHDGQRAPGTPAGIYFTRDFSAEAYFMNSRNQIVFRSFLRGPGLDYLDNGIWLAEPDGTVQLIVRRGDLLDIGVGVMARVSGVSFGADSEFIAGPEDGRRTPFNDRGEVALSIGLEAATPPFTGPGEGIFIVQTGIILRAERTGNDIHVKFPTLNGKHYRVDYRTNLSAGSWSVLAGSVAGTGGEFIVTDPGVAPSGSRYYQVVRTD